MSKQLRDEWQKGTDLRVVIVDIVARRFYDIVDDDPNKDKEYRVAVGPNERRVLLRHFDQLFGMEYAGSHRGDEVEIKILESGILAQIKAMDAQDLDRFEDALAHLFDAVEGDDVAVRKMKARMAIVATSVVQHYRRFGGNVASAPSVDMA